MQERCLACVLIVVRRARQREVSRERKHDARLGCVRMFATHAVDNRHYGKMGLLQLKDGFLYDPLLQRHVIPRGMAFQTWNPGTLAAVRCTTRYEATIDPLLHTHTRTRAAIFQVQSQAQIKYDLTEMRRMYCNSVRVEFVYPYKYVVRHVRLHLARARVWDSRHGTTARTSRPTTAPCATSGRTSTSSSTRPATSGCV